MPGSASAMVAQSSSAALRELADESQVGDDGGEASSAGNARLRRLYSELFPWVEQVIDLETDRGVNEMERNEMKKERERWENCKRTWEVERQWWERQRSTMKTTEELLTKQAVVAQKRVEQDRARGEKELNTR